MVYRLRKLHRRFFLVIALLLPLLIWASLYFRVSQKNTQRPNPKDAEQLKKFKHQVYSGSSFTGNPPPQKATSKILIDIFSNKAGKASKYAIVLTPTQDFRKPDVLAYLVRNSLKKKGKKKILPRSLKNAILLGEMAGTQRKIFVVSRRSFKRNRYLMLYSQAYSEILAEIPLASATEKL